MLVSGENDPTWDAGLYRPASLGDRVWIDNNGNGAQDTGEVGVANVDVLLLNSAGNTIGTTATKDTGNYEFTGLAPGTYSVQFVVSTLPMGTTITGQNEVADTIDSDGSPTDGARPSPALSPAKTTRLWTSASMCRPLAARWFGSM